MTSRITDEAVKAAAKAIRETPWKRTDFVDEWDGGNDHMFSEDFDAAGRAALEAAEPHMAPVVDREALGRTLGLLIAGFEAGDEGTCLEWAHCGDCPRQPGPCACSGDAMARRELVDAVLALLNGGAS